MEHLHIFLKRSRAFLIFSLFCTTSFAQNPASLEWVYSIGGFDFDHGYAITTDPQGNIFTMGSFSGSIDLDPGPDTFMLHGPSSGRHLFIYKMDYTGKPIWARHIEDIPYITPSPVFAHENQLATDALGNVYVTGTFNETIDVNPGPGTRMLSPQGSGDIFTLKLNKDGGFIWATHLGGNNATLEKQAISVDATGNVFVSGNLRGTVDFDPGPNSNLLSSSAPYRALFIQKLDTQGNLLWAHALKNNQDIISYASGTDSDGNFLHTGVFWGSLDVDPGPGVNNISSPTSSSLFLLKLDPMGNFSWVHQATADQSTGESYFDTDDANNVYLGGRFKGTLDLDPGVNTLLVTDEENGNTFSTFFQILDAQGNFQWGGQLERIPSGNSLLTLKEVEADGSGNFYIRGQLGGAADFDLGPDTLLQDASNQMYGGLNNNVYIARYSPQGEFQWYRQIETFNLDFADMEIDPDRNILFTGTISGNGADFDPGPDSLILTSQNGLENFFLGKWVQDNPCSSLTLSIEESIDVTCNQAGRVSGFASGGTQPYLYTWNDNPAWTDTFLQVTNAGIYDLTVRDSMGCSRTTSTVVSAPVNLSGSRLRLNTTSSVFRSGFDAHIWLNAFNEGCVPDDGIITLLLDPFLSYQGASIEPDTVIDQTLIWFVKDLHADSPLVKIRVDVLVSTVPVRGTQVCVNARITPQNQLTFKSRNSQDRLCKAIVASYDPNDKRNNPEGLCAEGYVLNNEPITYTVRFQNVGDVDAINIFILDTLDTDLDIDSLKIVGKSHEPMITEVLLGGILKFRFDGIHLPDSTTDEPNSHGYVMFEIKPKAGLPSGTQLINRAGIYFDFNDPVITNEVLNTLLDVLPTQDTTFLQASGCGSYELNQRIYASSGTFFQHLQGTGSCDSIVALTLSLPVLDTSVSLIGTTLQANHISGPHTSGSYQWVDCDNNNAPITAATSRQFTPEKNGNYAVLISEGACSQMSACTNVSTVGIDPAFLSSLHYFPNPTTGHFHVDLSQPYATVGVEIYSPLGQRLKHMAYDATSQLSIQLPQQAGLYLVKVRAGEKVAVIKVLKK